MEFTRKYGKETIVKFPLIDYGGTDFENTPVTFAEGDVQISKDAGAFANVANLPTHVGNGFYVLTLTAAERQAELTAISIIDAATKEWEDQGLIVYTKDPYNGYIHIDPINGTPGTAFPNGSKIQPVNNLTDAKALADANNVSAYHVHGSITLNADHKDWSFYAGTVDAQVDIAGFDVKNSQFFDVVITGTQLDAIIAKDCTIEDLIDMDGRFEHCQVKGDNAIKSGANVVWVDCYSGIPGLGTPTLDMAAGGGADISIRRQSGSLNVKNMTSATSDMSFECIPGRIIIDNTCTAGTIVCRGVGTITDSSNGTIVNKDGFIDGLVEADFTLQEAMSLILSVLCGKSSGGGTDTVGFRDMADAKDRITATVDPFGNRTAVVVDKT